MFALVLIIIPGVIALAKGGREGVLPPEDEFQLLGSLHSLITLSDSFCLSALFSLPGKTENFQNGFEVASLTLDRLPLAFYNGLYAYGGW